MPSGSMQLVVPNANNSTSLQIDPKSNHLLSAKGFSVQKPMTPSQRHTETKRIINSALKISDRNYDKLTLEEKMAYEKWLRELLKSWQDISLYTKLNSSKKGGKTKRNRRVRKTKKN